MMALAIIARKMHIFDFDPARTLTIFEEFANDLSSRTADGRGDTDTRKNNIRELLNFFPVIGEDENGEMIELDAEKVLSIPRRIHAVEVVRRGFMSDFLFQNISNKFHSPPEVVDMIYRFEPTKEADVKVTSSTADGLSLNLNGDVEIPKEKAIGIAQDMFGDKIFSDVMRSTIAVSALSKPATAPMNGSRPLSRSRSRCLRSKLSCFISSMICRAKLPPLK
jgi:hypothetical protein